MQRKSISLVILLISGLTLIGCNRGCTTTHTIASESKVFASNGGPVEIVGRVVDYRTSFGRNNDVFDREVTHTFGLCYDVKFGTYEEKEFFVEGVGDPDKVDLNKELSRVKVVVSKDKNHIGLGIDGKVVQLIHLYQSKRIQTDQPNLVADGTMAWSKLNINSYPTPEAILTETLRTSCNILDHDKEAIIAFCDSRKPSDPVHRAVLDNWPSCRMAHSYLSEQNIQYLKNDKYWKAYAVKRGIQVVRKSSESDYYMNTVVEFAANLNSSELNRVLDSFLIENWGSKTASYTTDALTSRIETTLAPINSSTRKAIHDEAKNEFGAFLRTGRSSYDREAIECLKVLQAFGDTTSAQLFIQSTFFGNVRHFDIYDFLEVAYENMSVYTDYQQQVILEKTESTFAKFKDRDRSSYFSAIDDLLDCATLKRMIRKYPNNLDESRLPMRCDP